MRARHRRLLTAAGCSVAFAVVGSAPPAGAATTCSSVRGTPVLVTARLEVVAQHER